MKYPFREWENKIKTNLSVVQAYEWVDRLLIIDEEDGRKVLGEMTLLEFRELKGWEEVK